MRLILLSFLFFSNFTYSYTYTKDEIYMNVFVEINKKLIKEGCKSGVSEVKEYKVKKEKEGKPFNHKWTEEWIIKSCYKEKSVIIEFQQENREYPNFRIIK